jgi:uncharacterized membrane protein
MTYHKQPAVRWTLWVIGLLSIWIAWDVLLRYSLRPLGAGLPASLAMDFKAERFWIYSHVFFASVALILGPWQFLPWLRQRGAAWHRRAGRTYLLFAVGCGGVAALVLAMLSSSSWVARSGFGASALLWLYTGWQGFLSVRKGDLQRHRQFMLRNFSLAFGAVTLRLYLVVPVMLGIPFESAYPLIAWISWVPNLLLVEWWIRQRAASA